MTKKITNDLVVNIPDENTPGYLRRLIAGNKFGRALRELRNNNTPLPPDYYENLIEFLLGFVTEPEDKEEARELLLDATEQQYHDLLSVINGQSSEENPTSPEPTEKS